jgi:hypothetical protein
MKFLSARMWSYISLALPLKVVEIFRWNPRREIERKSKRE